MLHILKDFPSGPLDYYRSKASFDWKTLKVFIDTEDIITYENPGLLSTGYKIYVNFHEAGHGKGAPDVIGATCKRSADQLIAQRGDITNLYDFVAVLRERCPNIKISVIEDVDIEKVNKMIKEHEKEQKPFKGILLVHQVSGHIYNPNKLALKPLSCFCDNDGCDHYNLGTITYQTNTQRLQVSNIFTDSEDDMPLASMSHIAQEQAKASYGSGDYVLVKLIMRGKEYRYAAVCSKYDDEDGELTVTFLKVCNNDGTEFKINDNDIADVPYEDVIEKLPVPNLIFKRNTVIFKFKKPVNVYKK